MFLASSSIVYLRLSKFYNSFPFRLSRALSVYFAAVFFIYIFFIYRQCSAFHNRIRFRLCAFSCSGFSCIQDYQFYIYIFFFLCRLSRVFSAHLAAVFISPQFSGSVVCLYFRFLGGTLVSSVFPYLQFSSFYKIFFFACLMRFLTLIYCLYSSTISNFFFFTIVSVFCLSLANIYISLWVAILLYL